MFCYLIFSKFGRESHEVKYINPRGFTQFMWIKMTVDEDCEVDGSIFSDKYSTLDYELISDFFWKHK